MATKKKDVGAERFLRQSSRKNDVADGACWLLCQNWTTSVCYSSTSETVSIKSTIVTWFVATVVNCLPCHVRSLASSSFRIQKDNAPAYRTRQFSDINISGGSVCFMYDGILKGCHCKFLSEFVDERIFKIIGQYLVKIWTNGIGLFLHTRRAIARKPRDTAVVRCGLKFADIHYKFKSSQAPKARLQSYRHTGAK